MTIDRTQNEREGVAYTGTPSEQELHDSGGYATQERQERGPVAFIECVECIPCNPCESACPYHAITVGPDITALPQLDGEKCIGCGLCIAVCPGLAIYVKSKHHSERHTTISFPYEYVPLPSKGDTVNLTDRNGDVVCQGRVLNVFISRRNDRTAVVQAEFDKRYCSEVVSMPPRSDERERGR